MHVFHSLALSNRKKLVLVCATVKGMVFNKVTCGMGIKIFEIWSGINKPVIIAC